MIFNRLLCQLHIISLLTLLIISCSSDLTREQSVPSNEKTEELNTVYLKPDKTLHFLPQNIRNNESEPMLYSEELLSGSLYKQMTLENGLKVDFMLRHDLPGINISLLVAAGKYQLNSADEYLSPLVLKLLKQGTTKYSKENFQQKVSKLGNSLKYRQTAQYSIISADILPQDLSIVLDLFALQVSNLSPGKDALKSVIDQQLLENKLTQSSGTYLAKLLFYQNNYPPTHLYYHLQPESLKIKKLTEDDLMDFYYRKYNPESSQLIITGDVESEQLVQQVTHYFSNWNSQFVREAVKKTSDNDNVTLERKKKGNEGGVISRFDFIERSGSQQVDLLYGVVTVARNSEDWPGLKIIASIIGGGPSSRLFSDLREQQGLAYYISAYQLAGRYASPFLIQTSVAHDKLLPTIVGIKNHIAYLCQNKIGETELKQIKQQLSGEIIFKLQNNKQRHNSKIQQLENNLKKTYLKDLKNNINAVTSDKLFTIVNQYLCSQSNVVAVGESKRLDKAFFNAIKEGALNAYRFQLHQLPLY